MSPRRGKRLRRGLVGGLLLSCGAAAAAARTDFIRCANCEDLRPQAGERAERALDATRYELGRRLRAFERAFAVADGATRASAVPDLQVAVGSYFRADASAAASALDAARRSLSADDPAAAWADSLALAPETRCLDPQTSWLSLRLATFYELEEVERPEGELRLRVELVADGARVLGLLETSLGRLPQELRLALETLPEGDHELRGVIEREGRVLARSAQTLSVVRDARKRLDALLALASDDSRGPTLERSSLRGLWRLLQPLASGDSAEFDVPAARLVAEAEEMAARLERGEGWLDATRAGDHWLRVPVEDGIEVVRLRVPADLQASAPRPLVVGLHGAGGSENMFFEAYGDGLAPRLAGERGWLFVSARAGFLTVPQVPALVDALAERLPVDRARVALIGHSMGAAHGMRLVSASPERFAAVALLSGGGSVRAATQLEALPFWLGAGEADFGLPATRRLAELLGQAGAEHVELHVVPHTEHLTVVQAALPEVFAFLDATLLPR